MFVRSLWYHALAPFTGMVERWRLLHTLALLAVLVSACGCRESSRQVRMVVAGSPSTIVYVPHVLAQQLGLYERQGLQISVDNVAGGSKGLQALLGGSADVVAGYFDHPVRMAAQGRRIRSFVTMTNYPGNVLLVSPATKKPIRSIKDLRGAVVGVSGLGSQVHLMLNYLLVQHGVSPDDVQTIPTAGQAAGVAALETDE